MAYSWASNIYGFLLMANPVLLIAWWIRALSNELNQKLSQPFEFRKMYRQLQYLGDLYNWIFSSQIAGLLSLAFPNQVSVNYGSLRLYNSLSFVSWLACPYLAISGLINLLQLQSLLSLPYIFSQFTIHNVKSHPPASFKSKLGFNHMRRFVRSCPPLKVKRGGMGFFTQESAFEFADSLVDKTVTMILLN
jgi:hypothetical protein